MSKKLMYIVLCFTLLLIPCNLVCAASSNESTNLSYGNVGDEDFLDFHNTWLQLYETAGSRNDKGQIYKGYVDFVKKDNYDQYTDYFYSFWLDNPEGYLYIVCYPSGGTRSNTQYRLYGSGTVSYYRTYSYDNGTTDGSSTGNTLTHVLGDYNDPSAKVLSLYDWKGENTSIFLCLSSIPVFFEDDEDAINAYIESGDYSGAVNSDSVDDANDKYTDEYDESIPIPHDFKVIKGVDQSITGVSTSFLTSYNHDIVLSWTQEDAIPNLQFEIEGNFYYKRLSDSDYTEIQEMNDGFKTVVPKTLYGNSSNSMTCQIGKDTLNGHISRGYQTKVQFRIRNVVGNKTSNWVLVTLDLVNKTASATEQDYYDNSDTGGNEYNDDNVNYDSDTGNSVTGDFSINGILAYIKSGFGLLGDNGIIALMSRTYLYLPASVWTIIKFFISMLVAICVIKLVKEVLL